MVPNNENGASDDKFFNRQRGRRIKDVIDINVFDRLNVNPAVAKMALKVSARIIE